MGFKHAMLQRSYELSPSPARTPPMPTNATTRTTHEVAPPAVAAPPVQVTDFSISRILGKEQNSVQDVSTNILDLSKNSSHISSRSSSDMRIAQPGGLPQGLPVVTSPYGCYSMLPPDLVAMANATQFYAKFFPHLLPAYAAAAAAAGLSTPPTSPYQQHLPQQHPPQPQQKRYFAPYVINSQMPHHPQQQIRTKGTACTRLDCQECLDYYQRLRAGYKQSTPLISPAASSVSSSSGAQRPVRELTMAAAGGAVSSNISLSSVTSLNLNLNMAQTAVVSSVVGSNAGVTRGYNTAAPEEISYKCRICEKVFGCSETLQVSIGFQRKKFYRVEN